MDISCLTKLTCITSIVGVFPLFGVCKNMVAATFGSFALHIKHHFCTIYSNENATGVRHTK